MRYYNRLVADQISNSRRYIQTAKSQFVRVEKDIVLRWSEETEVALLSLKPILEYLRGLMIVSSALPLYFQTLMGENSHRVYWRNRWRDNSIYWPWWARLIRSRYIRDLYKTCSGKAICTPWHIHADR
jgi:hypothetical protein